MGTPSDSIVAKLARAEEHVHNLDAALAGIRQRSPIRTRVVTSADQTRHSLRAFGVAAGPPEVSLLVGEVLYQLRSTLDHLVYELVIRNGGRPTSRTEFPICPTRVKYQAAAIDKLNDVASGAQDAIERLQPYHAGDGAGDEVRAERATRADELFVL